MEFDSDQCGSLALMVLGEFLGGTMPYQKQLPVDQGWEIHGMQHFAQFHWHLRDFVLSCWSNFSLLRLMLMFQLNRKWENRKKKKDVFLINWISIWVLLKSPWESLSQKIMISVIISILVIKKKRHYEVWTKCGQHSRQCHSLGNRVRAGMILLPCEVLTPQTGPNVGRGSAC